MKLHITKIICLLVITLSSCQTAPIGLVHNEWLIGGEINPNDYHGITLGTGFMGVQPWKEPFSIKQVILNSVYDEDSIWHVSYGIKGLNPFSPEVIIDGVPVISANDMEQEFDIRNARLNCKFTVPSKARIEYRVTALRNLPFAAMTNVTVTALSDIFVQSSSKVDIPEEYSHFEVYKDRQQLLDDEYSILRATGVTDTRRIKASSAGVVVGKDGKAFPEEGVDIKKGDSISFTVFGAQCTNRDFLDPENESVRQVMYAIIEGAETMQRKHEEMWNELWQSDIIISGDKDAQRMARMSLYHLYAFAREGSRLSIPPYGLSDQNYSGHIFWDAETWMYPPLLFLNQGMAKSMMDYRIDRLEGAEKRAAAYGYKGALFPWESDDCGNESTPIFASSGLFEHHISADIAIAAWNYYLMTSDLDWLKEKGWPLINSVAVFLMDRLSENKDGSFSIKGVCAADEYAEYVDDNAFTNASAIKTLKIAYKAAKECGRKPDLRWKKAASKIRILRNDEGIIMEYDGYDGRMIKQADVNLLAYPLGIDKDKESILRNLEYYEPRIDPHGPAMSYVMLALIYARAGMGEKSYELFIKSFKGHEKAPFGLLTEVDNAGIPFFATGAGGLLQLIINGYCGLELTDNGIVQRPSDIPPSWESITVTGVGPKKKTYYRVNKSMN